MGYKTINIENNMPTVNEAKSHLLRELKFAKTSGIKALKIIHGYGSSGTGGKIKKEVHRTLKQKQEAGEIKVFVPGEDFTPFEAAARRALTEYSPLRKDKDFTKTNHGITIVVL